MWITLNPRTLPPLSRAFTVRGSPFHLPLAPPKLPIRFGSVAHAVSGILTMKGDSWHFAQCNSFFFLCFVSFVLSARLVVCSSVHAPRGQRSRCKPSYPQPPTGNPPGVVGSFAKYRVIKLILAKGAVDMNVRLPHGRTWCVYLQSKQKARRTFNRHPGTMPQSLGLFYCVILRVARLFSPLVMAQVEPSVPGPTCIKAVLGLYIFGSTRR